MVISAYINLYELKMDVDVPESPRHWRGRRWRGSWFKSTTDLSTVRGTSTNPFWILNIKDYICSNAQQRALDGLMG